MKTIAIEIINNVKCTLILDNGVVNAVVGEEQVILNEVVHSSNIDCDLLKGCLLKSAYNKWKAVKMLEEVSFE